MRISLFITCYNDTLFPRTGQSVVHVLERLGHTIHFPREQTCCGQMHFNTGYRQEAYPLAKRWVEIFADAEAVCIPSSSCVAMIREYYPALARENKDAAMQTALEGLLPRIFEFSELLVDRLGISSVGAYFPHRVTYHASCHGLRSLHLGEKPLQLLRAVRGLELVPLENVEECCGFGGTFAIKNADVSAAMLTGKMRAVLNTRAEVCTAVDNSCLMHLQGMLHRQFAGVRTLHLAEILAETEGRGA
ncbi:MAG: cysteine-rich domain protein [Acidobacteriaceae bacterium]|nr:cysteine-rich domain protein [Acidobacteriaceae bacterium]